MAKQTTVTVTTDKRAKEIATKVWSAYGLTIKGAVEGMFQASIARRGLSFVPSRAKELRAQGLPAAQAEALGIAASAAHRSGEKIEWGVRVDSNFKTKIDALCDELALKPTLIIAAFVDQTAWELKPPSIKVLAIEKGPRA